MLRWFVIVLGLCACNQIFHIPDVTQGNVDECSNGLAMCSPDATCTDTPDSYTCACNQGFEGDGKTCTDIDECAMSPCGAHGTCTNTPGSYTCTCDSGFSGDGTYCVPATWDKLVAAGNFTCGLSAGAVYCWGSNVLGALGDGTFLPHARPVQVGTATDWTDVDARFLKACGLRSDHSIWCWGWGEDGMLGDGMKLTENAPTMVVSDKPGVGWKALSVGKWQVCGIHDDGSLACWGLDRITSTVRGVPVAVDTNTDWTAVAAGSVNCGLRNTSGGNLYCWGRGLYGDLGLGPTVNQATPARVGTDTWQKVSMGYENGCAIRTDGTLWCWGNNIQISDLQYGTAPMEVDTHTDWTDISASIDTIAGVRGTAGAFMWGNNQFGQAGLPTLGTYMYPTQLGGSISGWTSVRAGNTHTCGVANNHGYCWGTINDGNLGNGVSVAYYVPTRIGTETYSEVSLFGIKCAITTMGALECWGDSSASGVGFGNIDAVWAPTRLGTDTWSTIASGLSNGSPVTCGVHGGNLSCWGDNTTGELGIGSLASPQLAPAAVTGSVSGWTSVSASDHTCAITTAGALYCWGSNATGESGTGTASATPTTAPGSPITGQWLAVAASTANNGAGASMTCAIRGDHTLWCWGIYDYPNMTEHDAPTQVGTDSDWATIATTGYETCGVKLGGELFCWGLYLGDGTQNTSPTPVRVGTDSDWKSVSTAAELCAIKTTGTLWCWGNEFGSTLGNGYVRYDAATQQAPTVLTPTQIGSDSDWTQASAGGDTCAVKTDGSLWCWGSAAAPIPQFVSTPSPIM
jgi:alpha-tubulin suppressor-like RCC1 family protein